MTPPDLVGIKDNYSDLLVIYTNANQQAFGIYVESGFTLIDFPTEEDFVQNN
ncbi:MAG: hypothetical protein ACRCY4_01175 [Brevinema sp.]